MGEVNRELLEDWEGELRIGLRIVIENLGLQEAVAGKVQHQLRAYTFNRLVVVVSVARVYSLPTGDQQVLDNNSSTVSQPHRLLMH